MINNNKGAAAILLILIISSLLLSFLLLLNFQPSKGLQNNIDTIISNRAIDLGIDEGVYEFNENKNYFIDNINGCKRINSSIPLVYSDIQNDDLFFVNINYNEDLNLLNNSNYINNNGYLNRVCTLYQNSYPYNGNQNYIIHKKDLTLDGDNYVNDKNGMYYIKEMKRDENKGFIFTTSTLKDENGFNIGNNQLKFKVVYNILNNDDLKYYGGIDYLKSTKEYQDAVKLMQSKGLEITKSSILSYFGNDLENIYNDAKIEIGLIEYDGKYSYSDKDFVINTSSKPKVIKRNLCNTNGDTGIQSCILDLTQIPYSLQDDKLYFVYYKTYDKGTTTIFEIQDNSSPVNFISGDLNINLYGNSQQLLVKGNYIKEKVIGSELSSGIFNYLYYSQN